MSLFTNQAHLSLLSQMDMPLETFLESRMEMVIERLTSKSGNRLHLLLPHRSLRMKTSHMHTSYCPNQNMKLHHDNTLSEDEELPGVSLVRTFSNA